MKKILLFIVVIAMSALVSAQEKFATYTMSYFQEMGEFPIKISKLDKKGKFSVYIYVMGESEYDNVCITIKSIDLPTFRQTLTDLRDKFVEWKEVATENNVTDMKKEFPYSFNGITIAWLGSKWFFSYNNIITPLFVAMEDGKCVMIVYKNATSSSNQYIDQKVYFVLQEKEEFDNLLNVISEENINDYLNKRSNAEDLFR